MRRDYYKSAGNIGGSASTHKCYASNQPGHFANKYHNKKITSRPRPQLPSIERLKAMGRVFVITIIEAIQSGNLILDYCLYLGNSVLV